MRLALLSDVHGNAVALDAVLADLATRRADATVCLGDMLQGGAEPARVVAQLKALGAPVVMGNADAWLLSGRWTSSPMAEPQFSRMEAVRRWSLSQLSEADRAFAAAFAPRIERSLPSGRRFVGFHAVPENFDDVLLPGAPDAEFLAALGPFAGDVCAGGHTHAQQLRRFGTGLFVNPGSIGLAYAHGQTGTPFRADPWAEYALLDFSERGDVAIEFHRVPYDVEATLAAMRAKGRPHVDEWERMLKGEAA